VADKHSRIAPKVTERARRLRQEMTWPEKLFWNRIKTKQFLGLKFRKQHPIGHYIVDFYCASLSLIIEIDGMSHTDAKADECRQRWLEERGNKVLRYSNDDVVDDVDSVIEDLEYRVGLMTQNHPPLAPP
jgi:ATP-dependent helicase HrpA/adenine-specific DNA-methyltransferase